MPALLHGHEVAITLILLALLGAVFLRGFTEAIGIAVVLVGVYLALNVVVIAVSIWHVVADPSVVTDWTTALTTQHGDPLMIVALSLLVFPKLALGMSGFETGVAVMTHVQGDPGETEADPAGRIRGTKRMLAVAAADHERLPGHQQLRHHPADPARPSSRTAARRRAGRWPTSRTGTSATGSARCTT